MMSISGSLLIHVYLGRSTTGGEHDTDQRPPSRAVLRFDRTAMGLHDCTADRETKSHTVHASCLASVELLPHTFLIAGREPRSAIRNCEDHITALRDGGYNNVRTIRR